MRRLWFILTHAHLFLVFVSVFVREMVVANAIVAWEVLTPGLKLEPGIVLVPTSCTTDTQISILANALTMTPGTLSLEVDTDTRELYVHGLYFTSRERFVSDVHAIERVLLRAMT